MISFYFSALVIALVAKRKVAEAMVPTTTRETSANNALLIVLGPFIF